VVLPSPILVITCHCDLAPKFLSVGQDDRDTMTRESPRIKCICTRAPGIHGWGEGSENAILDVRWGKGLRQGLVATLCGTRYGPGMILRGAWCPPGIRLGWIVAFPVAGHGSLFPSMVVDRLL